MARRRDKSSSTFYRHHSCLSVSGYDINISYDLVTYVFFVLNQQKQKKNETTFKAKEEHNTELYNIIFINVSLTFETPLFKQGKGFGTKAIKITRQLYALFSLFRVIISLAISRGELFFHLQKNCRIHIEKQR